MTLWSLSNFTSVSEISCTTPRFKYIPGGLVLHEVLPRHSKSAYGKIVRDIMTKVCSARGDSVHLLLDRYAEPSIKDVERLKRGADQDERNTFKIMGVEQQQRKKGL